MEAYCKNGELKKAKERVADALDQARRMQTTRLLISAREKHVYIFLRSEEDARNTLSSIEEFGELCRLIRDTNSLGANKRIFNRQIEELIELRLYDKAITFATEVVTSLSNPRTRAQRIFVKVL